MASVPVALHVIRRTGGFRGNRVGGARPLAFKVLQTSNTAGRCRRFELPYCLKSPFIGQSSHIVGR